MLHGRWHWHWPSSCKAKRSLFSGLTNYQVRLEPHKPYSSTGLDKNHLVGMGVVAFPGQNEAEGSPRAWVLPYSLYAVDPGVGKVSARLWGQERLRDG